MYRELKRMINMREEYLKFSFKYPKEEVDNWTYAPLRLNIQVSKKCNQKCISCNSPKVINENELTTNEILNCITQATEMFEIKNIAFTGGEPLLKKSILEIIHYAKNRSSGNVSITTNGQLIKTINDAEALIRAGINNITLSYHGFGVHDAFTKLQNAETNILKSIQYLQMAKNNLNNGLRIKIGTLLTEWNYDSLSKMLEWCEENKLELYLELPDSKLPIFSNTDVENIILSDSGKIASLIKKLKDWKINGKPLTLDMESIPFFSKYLNDIRIESPCPLGFYDIYIDSIGNVYPGCWVLPPIGNIRSKNLSNILSGTLRKQRIYEMLSRTCPGCSCGYGMMSKYYIPYILESNHITN